MSEAEKRKLQLKKEITLADDLLGLEGNKGWERVKGWMEESVRLAKDNLADEKKTRSMVDVSRYQQTVRLYEKLLGKIEIDKRRGLEARGKLNG